MGWGRVPRPAGGVSYGTRVPVREGTGMVPGPLGAFPGAPRCEGQSGRRSGEAREGGLFPLGPRSLRPLKRRGLGESSTKPRAEEGSKVKAKAWMPEMYSLIFLLIRWSKAENVCDPMWAGNKPCHVLLECKLA